MHNISIMKVDTKLKKLLLIISLLSAGLLLFAENVIIVQAEPIENSQSTKSRENVIFLEDFEDGIDLWRIILCSPCSSAKGLMLATGMKLVRCLQSVSKKPKSTAAAAIQMGPYSGRRSGGRFCDKGVGDIMRLFDVGVSPPLG